MVKIFSSVYHPQDVRDEKVCSALAHWEHGIRDGIVTESWQNYDGTATDFWWFFRQSFVRVTFRRDFPWNLWNHNGIRVFISPCCSNPYIKIYKNSTTKVHPKCIKCWGVWNANARIAFLFADAFLVVISIVCVKGTTWGRFWCFDTVSLSLN